MKVLGEFVPGRKTGRNVVVNVSELGHEMLGLIQNLLRSFVCVLSCSRELGASLEQRRKRVLDGHHNLLLRPTLVALWLYDACMSCAGHCMAVGLHVHAQRYFGSLQQS